jgi:hypothetical protein
VFVELPVLSGYVIRDLRISFEAVKRILNSLGKGTLCCIPRDVGWIRKCSRAEACRLGASDI